MLARIDLQASSGDPRLSSLWTTDYPAMPGTIPLVGIFLVVVIEMLFHPCRRGEPSRGEETFNDHVADLVEWENCYNQLFEPVVHQVRCPSIDPFTTFRALLTNLEAISA